ncbi:uncharacterized protein LOC128217013 isoform X4 [Mya arenaria]|uniref:uncharacterized protein LOC128217013 isoform X4 n=1 Tax=Mya arenaria TaxID=6604 RepID=UPI0022E062F6|nr:uncharacterized protein LOC128217013 isoform X4 [Mya arenaria]
MGTGASKDGEEIVDDYYVTQTRGGSARGSHSPRPRSDKRPPAQRSGNSMSRNVEPRGNVKVVTDSECFVCDPTQGMEEPIVGVTKNGFTAADVVIMEGQTVIFVWQEQADPVDIVQVIHDGDKLRPVIGGFSGNHSKTNGQYEQQFNMEGEYKFALSGVRCTPLLITVRRRIDLLADVTDDGFTPDVIYIDQGHSIKWQWKNCTSPHSVQEVKYEMNAACFKRDPESSGNVKTVSGSYRHSFPRPGMYYFITEGRELGKVHYCVVHVRETQREYRVEIMDRAYQPMILLIEEGDRVWWSWDKAKCKKHHSVYEIEAPGMEHGDDDPYVPVKDGFRWTTPSKQGLLSHIFLKAGVYYFSDQNFQEAAEYVGTIIVKPKQKEHFVELTESGFNPDLVYAQTGDRIWWTWNGQACINQRKPQVFTIMESDSCLNPTSRKTSGKLNESGVRDDEDYQDPEVYKYMDEASLMLYTKVGLATTHFSTIGVYNYRIADSPSDFNTCSVIVNPGPKNHTIHLTDNGFEPKVITVRPNDRVWWVWQGGKKLHNIIQVSHQGDPIEKGFCSGAPRDAPSAFVHQFHSPGVFYFLSHSLPKIFGAIVVSTQPQVHEVHVGVDIKPDPVTIKINDIVCWIFRSLRMYDVERVNSIDQVVGNEMQNPTVAPRRCLSKAIMRTGVQHFFSKSFTKQKSGQNYIDDVKISSVLCDERFDNAVVRITKDGFHPAVYYIQKGQSVLWTWKGSQEEEHNVIHVKSPDSDEPLNVIHGPKSFNSGKPVGNNSFLYTFDEDGSYTVASQGAPGFYCTIVVMDVGMRVKEPHVDGSVTGGTVEPGTVVRLTCDTPGARIYYTADGSPAELHIDSVKQYKPDKGILLSKPGLRFIRAIAVKEGRINSHIFTSNRFWVSGDDEEDSYTSDSSEQQVAKPKSSSKMWEWMECAPTIKACFTNPGTLEVFWDKPSSSHRGLVKGYQIYLNGVTYCDMFPPSNNSLCVSGMAGSRLYEIIVEVFGNKPECTTQKSNRLKLKCPLVTPDGGPVISLERTEKHDALAIVWMSIDSDQFPISGYLVFLNDKQCGARLVPDPESNRCKVVIGSCELEKPYKVYVVAVPEEGTVQKDSDEVLMSNVLEVSLPLDSSEIRLPVKEARIDEPELYLEYLEISQGSGYLPAMDTSSRLDESRISRGSQRSRTSRSFNESHHSPHSVRLHPALHARSPSPWDDTFGLSHKTPPPARRQATPTQDIVIHAPEHRPLLAKESRPPPVIFDASTGDEQRQRGAPEQSVEVEEQRYRGKPILLTSTEDDQSIMTDDNEKSTQTSGQTPKRFQPRLNHDFIPPSLQEKGVSPRRRRTSIETESETETETDSDTESDTESETESGSDDHPSSMVVLDAQKPIAPHLQKQRKGKTPRTPKTPKSGREMETPRGRGVSIIREGRGYVEVEDDRSSESDRGYSHAPPAVSYEKPRKKRHNMAIIEVQDAVELDARRNELSMEEERQVAVPANTKDSMRQIDEGQFIRSDGEGILPAPSIMVESHGKTGLRVNWQLPRQPDPEYRLLLYVVNVVGTRFQGSINSDISFECNLVEKGKQVRGVQHCWNIQNGQRCSVDGLVPGLTYRLYVIANYTMLHGQQPCEIQTTSSVIYYTTVGPPRPPRIRVVSVDMHQALLEWDPPRMHEDLTLRGYQIYVDNKPLGNIRNKDTRQMMVNNLVPGKTLSIYVVAVTRQATQESDPSRVIHVTCPRKPPSIVVAQQPSYRPGTVLISWERPKGHTYATNEEDISLYGVYVDGKWYGEVKSNKLGNKHGYQFILNDLNPEQSYDISVKAISGFKRVDPDAQHVFSMSEGPMSNVINVMAPAAPKSPKLRLEGLTPEGIDVTWQVPQQHGDATISGYQMLKNGKLYGSIIPSEVNSLRIRDISLGEKVSLQLIALTDHPVGKVDGQKGGMEKTGEQGEHTDVFLGERYAGCRPGAKLVVHYTGLVCPPSQVWCERVTGHSALIVWNRDDEPKSHFIRPESYQVTWWPGDKPEDDINSDSTAEDHLLITNLRPATTYTVVVEARKMEKYKDIDEEVEAVGRETVSAFILTAKSDNLVLRTARPPDPPSNLGVNASTCSSLKMAWDPPLEHGVDVIGIRVDAVSLNTGDPHHVTVDAIPDATTTVIEGLREKTDYMVRITAITDEYFDRLPDRHRLKQMRSIPKDTILPADDSPWLPNASILTKTSGTEPPAALKITKASTSSLKLMWTPPIVYGSNKLQGVIVRWADIKYNKRKEDDDFVVASHVNLLPTEDTLTIDDLVPGNQYKIIVEAVVSVKTSLQKDDSDSGIEKYRRTAHIMSRPLYARTRAPTEPPILLITGYTQTTAQLYWEKPLLMSVVGKDAEGKPKYLRRYLEGYKLEINGKTYCHLGPASQSCQLTKCKPGKKYHVVLVALTCTESGKKERKRKYKGAYKNTNPQDMDYGLLLDDEDNLDASPSELIEITLPSNMDGYLNSLDAFFSHNEDRDNKTFGDVTAQWTTQGGEKSLLKQFNIVWYSHEDRVVQTKYVTTDFTKCTIPVTRLKAIYDIVVEPAYFTDTLPQQPQNIQIIIPGPPDPPEIFLKSSTPDEFVIEWGEPRLYGGVRVRGYQVYLNDKKAGNELSSTHRKAVIPCRPNRFYKVNLVALSANPEYSDSGKSNTLSINTSLHSPREGEEDMTFADDLDIPVKVTKVTETSISLDWSHFLETEEVGCYKIQWSSVAQPAEREVRLSNKDSNCVINKCLPGTTHFVRLLALDGDGQIKDRSKQLTVQTSAPPDAPCLALRACNFRYIAIQWDKPNMYGDALITGYKVYVNGIVESILNADQLSYTYTHGKWCQEYSFQVQALTAYDKMNSKPSEPLVIEWPGARAPALHRLPTHSSSNLRVGWEDPYLTDGVKIKHFRVCCVEEDTEKMVTSIGPVHPDTREAEFKHIKKGSYNIYLEVHLYGTSEIVNSDYIRLQPAPAPDAPKIAATVVGFDERRQIEKITCDLVNKRDRLIREVGHKLKQIGALTHPMRAEKDRGVIEAAHTLTRVEEILEDCFSALEHYTGQLIAHVSWQCPQSNRDLHLSGYNVLIDGKQYGNPMHEGVKTVRIKLGTEQPIYKLTMVSLTDKPSAASEESNSVDLLSEAFRPFSFYCYHSIHIKGKSYPDQGCCKYQDSIAYERQLAKKLANQGLLKKHVPPPSCSLLDVFEGDYKPLLQGHSRQYPTAIFFWTPWCLPSQKVMSYFARFSRETGREYNYIAVACNTNGTPIANRKDLIHMITANGWREDGSIWHATSQCASSIYEATNHIWKNTTGGIKHDADVETESNVDLTELLGIAGVPTFLFIHQEGYIAWHGRYSAYDYGSFAAFMRHTFSEVTAIPCPVFNCDSCKNDTSIDEEAIETVLGFINNQTPFKNVTIKPRPQSAKSDDDVERIFLKRKPSPKHRKQKGKLSVNQRPYSAHSTTYAYLLKSPYMERQTPSPKTHKVLMRPASSKNVQVAYETL